jgi:hypothetical protein
MKDRDLELKNIKIVLISLWRGENTSQSQEIIDEFKAEIEEKKI